MSSIIGHLLVGAAIGENIATASKRDKIFLCLFFAALGACPDMDYLPIWWSGFRMDPRYSHSIGACAAIALAALFLKKYVFTHLLRHANILLLLAAPLSHVSMDFLVGVHKNPVFWPLSNEVYAFNHGILPSAGRLDIGNYYFWRNLAIEMGILVPLAVFISATAREKVKKDKSIIAVGAIVFLFFSYIGHGLQR
jgi:hypothetical protein